MEAAAAPRKRRPNRPAAARRAQQRRAEGRAAERLLAAFAALSSHRGSAPTRLGAALAEALRPAGTRAERHAAEADEEDPPLTAEAYLDRLRRRRRAEAERYETDQRHQQQRAEAAGREAFYEKVEDQLQASRRAQATADAGRFSRLRARLDQQERQAAAEALTAQAAPQQTPPDAQHAGATALDDGRPAAGSASGGAPKGADPPTAAERSTQARRPAEAARGASSAAGAGLKPEAQAGQQAAAAAALTAARAAGPGPHLGQLGREGEPEQLAEAARGAQAEAARPPETERTADPPTATERRAQARRLAQAERLRPKPRSPPPPARQRREELAAERRWADLAGLALQAKEPSARLRRLRAAEGEAAPARGGPRAERTAAAAAPRGSCWPPKDQLAQLAREAERDATETAARTAQAALLRAAAARQGAAEAAREAERDTKAGQLDEGADKKML